MGRSRTINCIGLGEVKDNQQRMYYANNRLEIMQQTVIVKKRDGETITDWYAQTKIGEKILGCAFTPAYYHIPAKEIPKAKGVVSCPACEGSGCHICNYSGITQMKIINCYQDWQIENIKKEKGLL